MFFGYPIAATAENWLHECLSEIVTTIHTSLDAGNDPPPWPELIPAAHREALRSRHGLRDRLLRYSNALQELDLPGRERVLNSLVQQNDIGNLVAGISECECIDELPEEVQQPVEDLFTFAFKLLTEVGVRDRYYSMIYSTLEYKVCPFCGSEYFDAPKGPREDLDHYLAKHQYPFAAANLRNLVPMGMKCNSRYKLVQDILRDGHGVRRTAFNPYEERRIRLSLVNSQPFGGIKDQTPDWQIDFIPDSPECATWDDVFRLRERIGRDILAESYFPWLQQFAVWFRKTKVNLPLDDDLIRAALKEYAENAEIRGFTAREFLQAPLFEMLHEHHARGNGRLVALIRDLVTIAVPRAA